jgi:hypothetical protein
MYSVRFNLRNPKSDQETTIFVYVTANALRIKLSTKQKVLPDLWNAKSRRVTRSIQKLRKYEKRYPGIQSQLQSIQSRLDDISKEVAAFHMGESAFGHEFNLHDLKMHLQRFLKPSGRQFIADDSARGYLELFIKEATNGNRKKVDGSTYKAGTIKCYNNLMSVIKRFEKSIHKKLSWNDIASRFTPGSSNGTKTTDTQ